MEHGIFTGIVDLGCWWSVSHRFTQMIDPPRISRRKPTMLLTLYKMLLVTMNRFAVVSLCDMKVHDVYQLRDVTR